jgi:hypothetical protein
MILAEDTSLEPKNEPAGALVVAVDGTWFALDDRYVDLSRRKPLARILEALLERALVEGRSMTRSELVAAGWPGERILPRAACIRLRVAIATLRSRGLARHIRTARDGYGLVGVIRSAELRSA